MKKIKELLEDTLAKYIAESFFSSATPWQRFKWKIQDCLKMK